MPAGGVSTNPAEAGVARLSGNGQIVREQSASRPLRVIVRDSLGNPAPNLEVEWAVTAGGGTVSVASSLTDSEGVSSTVFVAPFVGIGVDVFLQSTVTAVTTVGSVQFTVTTLLNSVLVFSQVIFNPDPAAAIVRPLEEEELSGRAGETLSGEIQVYVTTAAVPGLISQPIPNVGLEIGTGMLPSAGPAAWCSPNPDGGGEPLTDSAGVVTCDVVLAGRPGTALIALTTGGFLPGARTIPLTVTGGVPQTILKLQGDGQTGQPGQRLPLSLIAQVFDPFGTAIVGAEVTWSVVSGDVTLEQTVSISDFLGRVATSVRLGSGAGTAQIRVAVNGAETTFSVTTSPSAATLAKVSGDNQSVTVNQAFAQPLVVRVLNAQGQPVQGASVSFTVAAGSAGVSPSVATTDSDGRASATATAGAVAGPVTVTVTVEALSTTFSLTVAPPGPIVTSAGIRSAISGDMGVAPGSIIAIYGQLGLTTQGSVVGNNNMIGPLPAQLAGVEVSFGTTPAPVYSVNNVNGQEFVVVQAPFSLVPGVTSVSITAGGGSTTVQGVQVKDYQPGIFETLGPALQRWAVLTKADGSYVSADNPVRRGVDTRLRMYCAGLGQTTPALSTNSAGVPNQALAARLVLGVRTLDGGVGGGVNVVSAEAMPGVVGVYVVTFDVPATMAAGADLTLVVAMAKPDGAPDITRIYYSSIPRVQ